MRPTSQYQTWGRLSRPLGSMRLNIKTRTVIVVEGLLDMLVIAQSLRERREDGATGVIYTGGASPSRPMLEWFAACAASSCAWNWSKKASLLPKRSVRASVDNF